MLSSNPRPKWWQLYLTVPLLIALFLLDARLKLPQRGHILVQLGILLLVYGLVHWWLKANSVALANMHHTQSYGRVTVIRVPPYQLPGSRNDERPLFNLSDPEIRGVLSDTFEMDYIDAKFVPVDEGSQELKKE